MKIAFRTVVCHVALLGMLLCSQKGQAQQQPGCAVVRDGGVQVTGEECPPATCCKRCIPVPEIKKVTHPVYACKLVDYCLPKCTCCCWTGCEQDCVECGKPRTKKVLLKKIVTEDKCGVKCEVMYESSGCRNDR